VAFIKSPSWNISGETNHASPTKLSDETRNAYKVFLLWEALAEKIMQSSDSHTTRIVVLHCPIT